MSSRKFPWNRFQPLYEVFRTQVVRWLCRFFRNKTLSPDKLFEKTKYEIISWEGLFHGLGIWWYPQLSKVLERLFFICRKLRFSSLYKREFWDDNFRTNHSHLLENSYHINYNNVLFKTFQFIFDYKYKFVLLLDTILTIYFVS